MLSERELIKLEKTIKLKMSDIKSRKTSLKDSGIGGLFNQLKKADEASYEKLLEEYKTLLSSMDI